MTKHITIARIITFILINLISFSCNQKTNQPDNVTGMLPPYIIDLENNFNNFRKTKLSEIADSIQYVPIETSKECLFKEPRKIEVTSDFIFISDFNGLYKFNRQGKFICRIGRQGNGPGEYKNVRTFTVDDSKKRVFIIFHYKHTIGIYNFDGEYIKPIHTDDYFNNIAVFDENNFVLSFPCGGYTKNEFNLYLFNHASEKIAGKYADYTNIEGMHSFDFSSLVKVDSNLYFNDTFDDTLFVFNGKMDEVPFCIFKNDKYKISETGSFPAKVSFVGRILPTKNYIYFIYMSPIVDYYGRSAIFNTQTGELFAVTPSEGEYKGDIRIYNDFDGILHIWPRYIGARGELVNYYDMVYLKNLADYKGDITDSTFINKKDHQIIESIIKNGNIEDNGVITIIYPK